MSTKTTNLELIKPELQDVADITAFNSNWDTLDENIKALYDALDDASDNDHTHEAFGMVASTEPAITDLNLLGTVARCTINRFNTNTTNAPTEHAGTVFTYKSTEENGVQFVLLSHTNATYTRPLKDGVWETWVKAISVTGGTFIGAIYAGEANQNPGTYLVRNSKLSATEQTPTVNGQICWQYE